MASEASYFFVRVSDLEGSLFFYDNPVIRDATADITLCQTDRLGFKIASSELCYFFVRPF